MNIMRESQMENIERIFINYKRVVIKIIQKYQQIINEVINKSKEWIDIWESYSGDTITFTNPYTPQFLI